MNEPTSEVLVISDEKGSLYLVSPNMLEQVRVPAEQRDAVQRAIEGARDDVSGFITPIPIPGKLNFQLLGTFQLPTSLTSRGTAAFDPGGGLGVRFDPGGGI